ncbi:pyridoxal phosphate-dependent aminotransferase [Streptomyces sp. NPDC098085]|uniref:pyridoxal phosphate-dependent aminotransferase n=1 Tax=Streptomyces sp. NPDC098085 TaxID=3366094 RepID=UPI003823F746
MTAPPPTAGLSRNQEGQAPDWIDELFLGTTTGVRAQWRQRVGGTVNLANNEMRHPRVEELIVEAVRKLHSAHWNSYPDYAYERSRFAEIMGVPAEQLLFTAGSDQTYLAVFRALTRPGTHLLTQLPNYQQIFPYAELAGLTVRGVDYRPGAGFPLDALLDAVARMPPGSLVTVSNPNGPTGAWWSADELTFLVDACAERRCLLLIDETYGAFAPETVLRRAVDWPHVLVVQSFSKGYGLAGARLAVCVCGSTEVADHIQRWNVSNPVSGPSLQVAAELALRQDELRAIHAELESSRTRLREEVPGLVGGWAETSWGNFVPVRCPDQRSAARTVEGLARRGFAIRHLERFGLPKHIRISTADLATTERLLRSLQETVHDVRGGTGRADSS